MQSTPAWAFYQPLIIGLGAVVLATLGNTLLEWLKLNWGNSHAAETLRRALVEELRSAKETADVNAERSGNPEPGGSFLIPIPPTYPIYETNISRLGYLEPDEVAAVVRAYANLRAQVETLAVIGTFHHPKESPVLHAIVDSKWSEVLASNSKSLSKMLDETIAALGGRLRV